MEQELNFFAFSQSVLGAQNGHREIAIGSLVTSQTNGAYVPSTELMDTVCHNDQSLHVKRKVGK